MPRNSLQNVDPSIRRMAQKLIIEGMDALEKALIDGKHFYIARDAFLESNVDSWVRLYGRECADVAMRGLCALSESEMLSPKGKAIVAQNWKADRLRYLEFSDTSRNSWVNRAWTRVFGIPLYALILAVVSFSAVHSSPAAAVEVSARFKALGLCGALRPGPERDKACARFNAIERNTHRDWDGPHGPGLREYELPRPYEIDPHD